MAFPLDLTAAMTGASRYQLDNWRRTGLLVPEAHDKNPALYSFQDLIALRTIVRLRRDVSLQKVRKALKNLNLFDLTEHPSSYTLAAHGDTILVETHDGRALDLVKRPGQEMLLSFADVFGEFVNLQGRTVSDFFRPREHLRVKMGRLGGIPTVGETRLPYDEVARAIDGTSVTIESIGHYFPDVTAAAAADALSFDAEVRAA